ncbi:MAG: hypothetical protein ACT4OU_03610 [Hyphomicrobium sp.]
MAFNRLMVPMRSLVAFLFALFAANAAAEDAWQVVKPDGIGFSIEMPVPPSNQEEDVDLGDGQNAKMRTYQILAGNAIYDVTIADYPKGTIASIGEGQILDNARDGAVKNAMGPLKSETKIEFAGRPARELLVDMTMGMTLRSHIFVVGDRLYNVGHIAANGKERSTTAEKFFASFKLIDANKP